MFVTKKDIRLRSYVFLFAWFFFTFGAKWGIINLRGCMKKDEELQKKLDIFSIHTLRGLADNLGKDNSFVAQKGDVKDFVSYICGEGDFEQVVSGADVDAKMEEVAKIIVRKEQELRLDSLREENKPQNTRLKNEEQENQLVDANSFINSGLDATQSESKDNAFSWEFSMSKNKSFPDNYKIIPQDNSSVVEQVANKTQDNGADGTYIYSQNQAPTLGKARVAQNVKEYKIVKRENEEKEPLKEEKFEQFKTSLSGEYIRPFSTEYYQYINDFVCACDADGYDLSAFENEDFVEEYLIKHTDAELNDFAKKTGLNQMFLVPNGQKYVLKQFVGQTREIPLGVADITLLQLKPFDCLCVVFLSDGTMEIVSVNDEPRVQNKIQAVTNFIATSGSDKAKLEMQKILNDNTSNLKKLKRLLALK